jgi:single-strand DNA-binding protein
MINKVILVGNLTADPEMRATADGKYVTNLRVATNVYTGKDDAGNARQATEYFKLVVFGKTAEFASQYATKGRLVYAEGRVQTNNWEDKSGAQRTTIEVIVDEFKLLGKRPEELAA